MRSLYRQASDAPVTGAPVQRLLCSLVFGHDPRWITYWDRSGGIQRRQCRRCGHYL